MMSWLEALILGILQGLTEFLPVSSSGHIEIGKAILGIEAKDSLLFTVVVHGATLLSIFVVFWQDIKKLFLSALTFKDTPENRYTLLLLISAIPIFFVGLFSKDQVEQMFSGKILLVGSMLIITAALLFYAHFSKPKDKQIRFWEAIIIGIAQAIAVIPGISRSGATISTALILGVKKEEAARFSFLMVIIPILGANLLELYDYFTKTQVSEAISPIALLVGFISAFLTGWLACSWMLKIVKNSKLIYFAVYCLIVGLIAVGYSFLA